VDARVRNAIKIKIDEAVSNAGEVYKIQAALGISDGKDFALGVAVGRIYNSFHYQTRRILGRNATDDEFGEFISMLTDRTSEIRNAFSR
jgi:hypothetical protein